MIVTQLSKIHLSVIGQKDLFPRSVFYYHSFLSTTGSLSFAVLSTGMYITAYRGLIGTYDKKCQEQNITPSKSTTDSSYHFSQSPAHSLSSSWSNILSSDSSTCRMREQWLESAISRSIHSLSTVTTTIPIHLLPLWWSIFITFVMITI